MNPSSLNGPSHPIVGLDVFDEYLNLGTQADHLYAMVDERELQSPRSAHLYRTIAIEHMRTPFSRHDWTAEEETRIKFREWCVRAEGLAGEQLQIFARNFKSWIEDTDAETSGIAINPSVGPFDETKVFHVNRAWLNF